MPDSKVDPEEYMDLIEAYRDKFNDAPPIFWADPPDMMREHMEKMRQAIDSGKPWKRPELENIPEDILI